MKAKARGPLTEEIVWELTDRTGVCWIWLGAKYSQGYGGYTVKHVTQPAHRAVYEVLRGPIPTGLVLDHLCRVRRCVNPDHLEPVTTAENTRRGVAPTNAAAINNTCLRGHPFTPENTRYRPSGSRLCRTCVRESKRRWSAQRKAAA